MTSDRGLNRLRVRIQKPTHFFQQRHELLGISVTQILRKNQVVSALFQGTFRRVHESDLVCSPALAKPFGNVRWD